MLWSVENCDKSLSTFQWAEDGQYARATKLTPDGNTLVVAGESNTLGLWDISGVWFIYFCNCNIGSQHP